MPFDGVVLKNVINDLRNFVLGGRIDKVYQPRSDEILISVRTEGKNHKIFLTANSSYPRIHITNILRENPLTPPNFCMVLRKYIMGGKITDIEFFDYERIVAIGIESYTELGDLSSKKLIIEIMGRHSNIILVNSENKIIDSLKHIDSSISSVREVMPARNYTFPPAQHKLSPEKIDINLFIGNLKNTKDCTINNYMFQNIKGFSMQICNEVCFRAGIDNKEVSSLDEQDINSLQTVLDEVISSIVNNNFTPCISMIDGKLIDFHSIYLTEFVPNIIKYNSISEALDEFYSTKQISEKISNLKADTLKILNSFITKCNKKTNFNNEKVRDYKKSEKYKLFGELILSNIYNIQQGSKMAFVEDYYSEESNIVEIPLNEKFSLQRNAQIYFNKYSKAKSAYLHATSQLADLSKESDYLESVKGTVELSEDIDTLEEIRDELVKAGYIEDNKHKSAKEPKKSMPIHYKSSDNFDIYVGKNNMQNDMLTFKMASKNDLWFHTKSIHGSHVIVRGNKNIPHQTLVQAAIIAAYHSKAQSSSNVEVDYTKVGNVRKPKGAKPGMVIYTDFKTMVVTPMKDIVYKLRC